MSDNQASPARSQVNRPAAKPAARTGQQAGNSARKPARKPARKQAARKRTYWRLTLSLLMPVFALLAYLLLWPIPVEPVSWKAPVDKGFTGAHATNTRLANLNKIPLNKNQTGPEHIITFRGMIYVGLLNGDVIRLSPDGQQQLIVNTGGRPLGLAAADDNTLYIADIAKGLLAINLAGKPAHLRTLADRVDHPKAGDPIRYADAVAVNNNSSEVWVSDASVRFDPVVHGGSFLAGVLDIMEGSCSGRLIAYEPKTLHRRVTITGLCFPNGLVFSKDGGSLFVSEMGSYRILKIDLARLAELSDKKPASFAPSIQLAMEKGAARVLIDNLPGYPDNLTQGEDGRIWTGMAKPRRKILDIAADKPWLRSAMLRLPRSMWPVPRAYGHIVAFDEDGNIVDDLQDPSGAYPEATSATEFEGKLYVQSLHAKHVGWLPYTGPGNKGAEKKSPQNESPASESESPASESSANESQEQEDEH